MTNPGDPNNARHLFREYSGVHEDMEAESDRAAAIIGVSYLHSLLGILLSVATPTEAAGKRFDRTPLSSRIDIAYALGLLPEGVYQDLHVLRNIRNDFAHALVFRNFKDGPMRDRLRNLYLTRAISEDEINAHEDISRRIHRQAINSIRQELILRIRQTVRRPEPEANSPVYVKAAKGEKIPYRPNRPTPREGDSPQQSGAPSRPTRNWYYVESNATPGQLEGISATLRERFGVDPRMVASTAGRAMVEFSSTERLTHEEILDLVRAAGASALSVGRFDEQVDPDAMY